MDTEPLAERCKAGETQEAKLRRTPEIPSKLLYPRVE